MRLSDSILIDCPLESLYRLASDVERHAEILPGYIESRIVERNENVCILQREAIINGNRLRWKSEVRLEDQKAIHFRQSEGPFKGMTVLWGFKSQGHVTLLSIIHDLHLRPRWKGWWIERRVAKPAIECTARLVLEAIKRTAEAKFGQPVETL